MHVASDDTCSWWPIVNLWGDRPWKKAFTTLFVSLNSFLGVIKKLRKRTLSAVLSECLSVCTERLGSQWTNVYEIWYLNISQISVVKIDVSVTFNPLNPELNPICYLLALLGAHHFLQVSRISVKLLTLRLLMSYIYGAPILDVSRSHTTTHHSR